MTSPSVSASYNRTELVWAGKRTHVDRIALPFQRVETINAPRGADMFSSLQAADGWRNKLIWGDNKLVMASLLRGDPSADIESLAGKIDLIYIDPPFDTGADFRFQTDIGDETIEKQPSILEHIAYRDTWGSGTDSYLQMIYDRLVLMRDLLAQSGSIWIHLDVRVNSYVRIVLDEIFAQANLRNEIVWRRANAHNDPDRCGVITDTIYYYARGDNQTWNQIYTPYSEGYLNSHWRSIDENGKRYRLIPLDAPRHGDGGNLSSRPRLPHHSSCLKR